MNNTKQPSKFTRFLRNNAALLLLILCVLAITAVVLAVTLTRNTPIIPDDPVVNQPNDDTPGNTDPDDKPNTPNKKKIRIHFASPISYTGIGMDFTCGPDNLFVFNRTLEQWETHKGLDLLAKEGANVVSMFEGTVVKIGSSYGGGEYVVVDHGENVVATYGSLQNVQVSEGQKFAQGDLIGEASTSASVEYIDGAHVHLEIKVNGEYVDPTPYVNGTVYREYEVEE